MLLSSLYYFTIFATLLFSILAIEVKDLLHATYLLAGAVASLSLTFFLLQAPDIAITQATIGAAISTAMFIFVISKTGREE